MRIFHVATLHDSSELFDIDKLIQANDDFKIALPISVLVSSRMLAAGVPCDVGDSYCQSLHGINAYCKYWTQSPACQGSNDPCSCKRAQSPPTTAKVAFTTTQSPVTPETPKTTTVRRTSCSAGDAQCQRSSGNLVRIASSRLTAHVRFSRVSSARAMKRSVRPLCLVRRPEPPLFLAPLLRRSAPLRADDQARV
jgi:hypothetical protein